MTTAGMETAFQDLRRAILQFVEVTASSKRFGVGTALSAKDRANLAVARQAIQICLDQAETPESLIELTRLLICDGVAGAYADQEDRW